MQEKIFFNPTGGDSTELFYILITLVSLILLISFIVYRFRRFKLFQEFTQEMTLLEFNDDQESALTGIVKRYSLSEPVSVLFSIKLFDELATKEISRVLGSPGSANQKQQFINMVYEIRKKTYFQDMGSEPQLNSDVVANMN